jgi:hypothetical protein
MLEIDWVYPVWKPVDQPTALGDGRMYPYPLIPSHSY